MATQEHTQENTQGQHLSAARALLDEVEASGDPQAKATAAAAHATLVLAEQVAAIRVMLVGNAVRQRSQGADGQAAAAQQQ